MTLIEKTAKCLEIKSRISWISSEWARIDENMLYGDQMFVNHTKFLIYELSAIIDYIKEENLELNLKYSYCKMVDKLYKKMRYCLKKSDALTDTDLSTGFNFE